MEKIVIKGIEIFAFHGVCEDEKKNGQYFYIDAELYADLKAALKSDLVDNTLNYAEAARVICESFVLKRFDLIEAAADFCAGRLMEEFPVLKRAKITVFRKKQVNFLLKMIRISCFFCKNLSFSYLKDLRIRSIIIKS